MEEIGIRAALPEDAATVSTLLDESYTTLLSRYYDPAVLARALPLMTRANPRLLDSGTYYLAVAGRQGPVGCGGWSMESPGSGEISPGVGHVRHFATHPEWTRRGVGRALLSRCMAEAAGCGINSFECISSLAAAAFYRALGFSTIRAIEVELAPGVIFAGELMEKHLQAARAE